MRKPVKELFDMISRERESEIKKFNGLLKYDFAEKRVQVFS